jgi:hypothetical protein
MEIEPVENLSINSEELIDNITKISALYEELLPQFSESFIFYGETLHDWSAKMVIKIPDNAKPPDLQTALIKLIHAIGMASHYKTVSSNLYTAITSSTNAQRNTIISNIVNETKNQNARRPAKDIIESMAEDFLKDIRNAELVAKIYKDFWTQKLDALIEIRKCIEQMNFSITTEMKYLEGQHGYT